MIDAINNALTPGLLVCIAVALLVFMLAAALYPRQNKRMKSRLQGLRGRAGEEETSAVLTRARTQLGFVGSWLASTPLIGAKEQAKMAAFLSAAGFAHKAHVSIYILIKVLLLLICPLLLYFGLASIGYLGTTLLNQVLVVMVGAAFGWYIPGTVINNFASVRRRQLEYGIADALDLLVICVEAGLGLEQALDRVSRDIAVANPVVAEELSKTVAEMRVMPQMRDALDNFSKRANIPAIKSVMTTLVQAVQYGTPLSNSLRVLAAEMRKHRMMKIEERAAQLPVLMTIPLIIFILPCLFIIIGGPAVLHTMDTLYGH